MLVGLLGSCSKGNLDCVRSCAAPGVDRGLACAVADADIEGKWRDSGTIVNGFDPLCMVWFKDGRDEEAGQLEPSCCE